MILTQSLRVCGLGLGLGLPSALAVSRVMSTEMVGVDANDSLVFVGTAVVVAVTAMVAAWLPARRAAAIEPVDALRFE